ncbi:MAG TPA: M4 family metallopeptidase [Myxococcota bacterium]|nr:M4 family metallopeptidase [Myxococcota bacterium]
MPHRHSPLTRHCIVPPHILRAMLQHDELRDAAVRTLLSSSRLREKRALLGALPVQSSTGTLRRAIYDAHHSEDLPGELVRSEGQAPANDSAVNAAYDGLGATYEFYQKVFNRSSIDGKGMRLEASVHYSRKYMNAYWDGHEMVFGDGDGVVFRDFTGAIDVIGHELTHGVTAELSGLEYHKQPGALNESFSDVMGSMVKQYELGQSAAQADWWIGEGILGPTIHGKALRSMKAPGTAYDDPRLGGRDPQPADMAHYANLPDDEWDDFGGVHINSGIPNHAFYLAATSLGGNAWDVAGPIWYETLGMLQPSSQFADCAALTIQVAKAHFGAAAVDAVTSAWRSVGVRPANGPAFARASNGAAVPSSSGQLEAHLQRLIDDLQALMRDLRSKSC